MNTPFGPTIAKRRLSRLLVQYRNRQGLTAQQVCETLGWGRGQLGRYEANEWSRPDLSKIRDLLSLYNLSTEEGAELLALAGLAREREWWRKYSDVFGDSEYPGFEDDAVKISSYTPLILPGLLQTPSYIEASLRVGDRPSEWRERALEARQRRQHILARDGGVAPEFVAVITEAALCYRWGSPEDRRAQIAHLIEMSRRPHVKLRLLRFDDGLHPGMSSLISILEFPGDEPPIAFLQDDTRLAQFDDPPEVDAYAIMFDRIQQAALEPAATTAHLKHLYNHLE